MDYPTITKMLSHNIAIDDRATSFMVKKEYKKKPKKEINKSVKLPTWFDNEQKDINVSEEEKKEIEALLKEFK